MGLTPRALARCLSIQLAQQLEGSLILTFVPSLSELATTKQQVYNSNIHLDQANRRISELTTLLSQQDSLPKQSNVKK